MALSISSPVFSNGGSIPREFTCEGADESPPLQWTGVPSGTKSLALIVDDPDAPDPAAPQRTFVHWVLYDVSPSRTSLERNAPPRDAKPGKNDWQRIGYGGPCPPIGRHRYFFKLHALDTVLGDLGEPTKQDLEQAMSGHVLERAELVGTYEKNNK